MSVFCTHVTVSNLSSITIEPNREEVRDSNYSYMQALLNNKKNQNRKNYETYENKIFVLFCLDIYEPMVGLITHI